LKFWEDQSNVPRLNMVQLVKCCATLILASVLGAAVWALAPWFVGVAEPWEGPFWYYPVALFLAGLIAALPWPMAFLFVTVGVAIGQLAYAALFLPSGPLWPIGLFVGLFFLLFAAFGAAIPYMARRATG
jgi:hypothetical protein